MSDRPPEEPRTPDQIALEAVLVRLVMRLATAMSTDTRAKQLTDLLSGCEQDLIAGKTTPRVMMIALLTELHGTLHDSPLYVVYRALAATCLIGKAVGPPFGDPELTALTNDALRRMVGSAADALLSEVQAELANSGLFRTASAT
jgi:hypothetical protein